ncbi:hypothetical protein K443DRAFT_678981 [Laccaria amethystina LaAM-08-1]|uniref:Transmembrane protein n=1 Tax=Laccaria amethystina LaAM-08-1 TaxID=1095629 RepID=A0A0C9WQP0_9AGAR|nr:hypothetical protein K443DRAFT_678981 [Laccaria amethystina LaAM-08-1]
MWSTWDELVWILADVGWWCVGYVGRCLMGCLCGLMRGLRGLTRGLRGGMRFASIDGCVFFGSMRGLCVRVERVPLRV